MDDILYREYILEHYKNPQNYGEILDPDFDFADSNPLCGDEIRIMVHIEGATLAQGGTLAQIKFTGQGCAISQASASILTEFVKGETLSRVQNLDSQTFLDELGLTLSPARLKCALLPYSALQKALTQR